MRAKRSQHSDAVLFHYPSKFARIFTSPHSWFPKHICIMTGEIRLFPNDLGVMEIIRLKMVMGSLFFNYKSGKKNILIFAVEWGLCFV